jgi:AcrR family transcriptional regulator
VRSEWSRNRPHSIFEAAFVWRQGHTNYTEDVMARPRTGDKRSAILQAATASIAAEGMSASTANIAKAAGVSEGSLFRYFKDKDELVNELYRELKSDMRHAMTNDFPHKSALKARAQHIWDAYLSWGVAEPAKRKAMAQLSVSDRISLSNRHEGQSGFDAVAGTLQQVLERGRLCELPYRYVSSLLLGMAEATMASMTEDPASANRYRTVGLEAFWSAVAKG